MSAKSKKSSEREEAIQKLREFIKPGMTIYTTLRHVSRSGMQRVIDLHVIQDNEPRWIGWTAATAMDDRFDDKRQGIVVGGCGMDMGFSLVYNLSRALFPDGFGCVGETRHSDRPDVRCPSNDHSNGDRDFRKHDACPQNPVTGNCLDTPCQHTIECGSCKGTGKKDGRWGHREGEQCATCLGTGWLEREHWHLDGGYALKHKWL